MSRANLRAPMRGSLSTRTGSQSEASKNRGSDEHERRVRARTSGEICEFSPDCRRSTSTFVRVSCVLLCLSTRIASAG
ncbi:hypothetical protein TSAR_014894 [Trichomalopsis sarcophagae]|uniref:Uncharacterized protein n=1 Tax=Trichomalopsis sarcophagae TaxID=543379 RepID=A0A232FB24_9HYME|nr:hypothetical protein TSAR_014894 [Trichomalopsis sarcophagae]